MKQDFTSDAHLMSLPPMLMVTRVVSGRSASTCGGTAPVAVSCAVLVMFSDFAPEHDTLVKDAACRDAATTAG